MHVYYRYFLQHVPVQLIRARTVILFITLSAFALKHDLSYVYLSDMVSDFVACQLFLF
jgi:hypothetical protein